MTRRVVDTGGIGTGAQWAGMDERPTDATRCAFCRGEVDVLQKGWRAGDPAYCSAHHIIVGRDPRLIRQMAIEDADASLDADVSQLPTWGWPSLDELAGPLGFDALFYIAAFPGGGKTTLISHIVHHWLAHQGLRVFHMPLEASPREWYIRLICLDLGMQPDDVLSWRLHQRAHAGDVWARRHCLLLREKYQEIKANAGIYEGLAVEPSSTLSVKRFKESLRVAEALGCDVVVTDHVDHVGHDESDSRSDIAKSTAIQHEAKEFVVRSRIPVVLMSQLNSKATGGDHLAKYRPPQMEWLWMKGIKEQIGTSFLGVYRPMREGLDDNDFREVRSGAKQARDLLAPNTMALSLMKGRYAGQSLDGVVKLHYEHGLISERRLGEAAVDLADRHGVSTRPPGAPQPWEDAG